MKIPPTTSDESMNPQPARDKTPTLSELPGLNDYDAESMPVAQARKFIRQFLTPLAEQEAVELLQAHNRTLASDIRSPLNVPPHNNSAMDGYALRHADLAASNARLRLTGTSLAGHPFNGKIAAGACIRIMTGALVPADCDTVIMQEQATPDGEHVLFSGTHKPGQNIRLTGEDIQQDAVVLPRGTLINAAEMGLLASLGLNEVAVFRKLRVAIFSTGDELQQPGNTLAAGQIYDSNRYSLFGLLSELGGIEILDLGNIRDEPDSLKTALQEAATRADVIITSGGVSVGEADFIKQLLAEIGEVVFWKIAMKPGRPLAYGKIGTCHFFGLPGNPVAVMVTFLQFVRDALRCLMGQQAETALSFPAISDSNIRKVPGRTEFQRGILSNDEHGALHVRTTGAQGSGILSSMSQANCFIVLPEDQGNVAAGDNVTVQLLDN